MTRATGLFRGGSGTVAKDGAAVAGFTIRRSDLLYHMGQYEAAIVLAMEGIEQRTQIARRIPRISY